MDGHTDTDPSHVTLHPTVGFRGIVTPLQRGVWRGVCHPNVDLLGNGGAQLNANIVNVCIQFDKVIDGKLGVTIAF